MNSQPPMPDAPPDADELPVEAARPPWYKSTAVRYLGYAGALVLLVASIWFAIGEGRDGGGFAKLAEAKPRHIAALVGLVIVTTVGINGLMFWVANLPFCDKGRPCGPVRMSGLLAASALLNYTPVKAGLVGRVAYLKSRHGVSIRASVLMHMMLSGAILGAIGACLVTTLWRGQLDAVWWVSTTVLIGAVAVAGALILHYVPPKKVADWAGRDQLGGLGRTTAVLLGCTALAAANILGVAVRWWLVGQTLSVDMAMHDAVFISLIHTLTGALPANGLGAREWLNKAGTEAGLLGKSLESSMLTISLVDRAAEVLVVVVTGLLALVWLGRVKKEMAEA